MDGLSNPPCLVYGTFNNKIYIYWDVCLPRISSLTLLDVMKKNDTFQEKLNSEGIEGKEEMKRHIFITNSNCHSYGSLLIATW